MEERDWRTLGLALQTILTLLAANFPPELDIRHYKRLELRAEVGDGTYVVAEYRKRDPDLGIPGDPPTVTVRVRLHDGIRLGDSATWA